MSLSVSVPLLYVPVYDVVLSMLDRKLTELPVRVHVPPLVSVLVVVCPSTVAVWVMASSHVPSGAIVSTSLESV